MNRCECTYCTFTFICTCMNVNVSVSVCVCMKHSEMFGISVCDWLYKYKQIWENIFEIKKFGMSRLTCETKQRDNFNSAFHVKLIEIVRVSYIERQSGLITSESNIYFRTQRSNITWYDTNVSYYTTKSLRNFNLDLDLNIIYICRYMLYFNVGSDHEKSDYIVFTDYKLEHHSL